jgi:hypothetical protein
MRVTLTFILSLQGRGRYVNGFPIGVGNDKVEKGAGMTREKGKDFNLVYYLTCYDVEYGQDRPIRPWCKTPWVSVGRLAWKKKSPNS